MVSFTFNTGFVFAKSPFSVLKLSVFTDSSLFEYSFESLSYQQVMVLLLPYRCNPEVQ